MRAIIRHLSEITARGLAFVGAFVLSAAGIAYILPANNETAEAYTSYQTYCVDFRASSGFVADPASCTYSTGGLYPETRGGMTFGWAGSAPGISDSSNLVDARLAGNNSASSSSPKTFELDLPAPGSYEIGLAMGDANSAQNVQYAEIYDGTNKIYSMKSAAGPAAGQYYDLTGHLYDGSSFFSDQALVPLRFTTKTLKLTIGKSGIGTNHTLANLTVRRILTDGASSAHYQFVESDLGGGGLTPSSSASYQATLSSGDSAIGGSSSANYQLNAGSQTTRDPVLSIGLDDTSATFGAFSPTTTATASSSFSVIDYTSYGYTVQIAGSTPTYRNHSLPGLATTSSPTPGKEEFGINLVKNTAPQNFGADPNHGQFAVGDASTNYGTANKFRYVVGETIASAPKSSGKTTYTISYIADVASVTPGGQYSSGQVIICTASY